MKMFESSLELSAGFIISLLIRICQNTEKIAKFCLSEGGDLFEISKNCQIH